VASGRARHDFSTSRGLSAATASNYSTFLGSTSTILRVISHK